MKKENNKFNESDVMEGMSSISAVIKAIEANTTDRHIISVYIDSSKKNSKRHEIGFLNHKSKELGFSIEFTDADNIAEPNFVEEMNKTFSDGYRIITSYRNSKNFGDNWISAGNSMWFLRDSQFLNRARMKLRTSCIVAGTGFLVHRDVLKEAGGWK